MYAGLLVLILEDLRLEEEATALEKRWAVLLSRHVALWAVIVAVCVCASFRCNPLSVATSQRRTFAKQCPAVTDAAAAARAPGQRCCAALC